MKRQYSAVEVLSDQWKGLPKEKLVWRRVFKQLPRLVLRLLSCMLLFSGLMLSATPLIHQQNINWALTQTRNVMVVLENTGIYIFNITIPSRGGRKYFCDLGVSFIPFTCFMLLVDCQ